jgi:MFS family permease
MNYFILELCWLYFKEGFIILNNRFQTICILIITDYIKVKYRVIAITIFTFGLVLGTTLIYNLGAFLNKEMDNWREIYYYCSIPSLIFLLIFIISFQNKEMGKINEIEKNNINFFEVLKYIFNNYSIIALCIGVGFQR